MSCIYKCSACRTRNTFAKPVHEYKRGRSCRHCGHRHFFVDTHRLNRKPCNCMAYHHPHRPGSGACGTYVDELGFLVKPARECPF